MYELVEWHAFDRNLCKILSALLLTLLAVVAGAAMYSSATQEKGTMQRQDDPCYLHVDRRVLRFRGNGTGVQMPVLGGNMADAVQGGLHNYSAHHSSCVREPAQWSIKNILEHRRDLIEVKAVLRDANDTISDYEYRAIGYPKCICCNQRTQSNFSAQCQITGGTEPELEFREDNTCRQVNECCGRSTAYSSDDTLTSNCAVCPV
eukprot:SAG25_NODE_1354_length_3222_cov_16.742235_2_plen_205_part_00